MIRNLSKLLLAGACALAFSAPALAGKFEVLHDFRAGRDGAIPLSSLTPDGQGNFYGTTERGGGKACSVGCGTVFRISPDGTEAVIYSFKGGADGALPVAGLTLGPDGAFYGTTLSGGANDICTGCGTVFRVTADGQESVLYTFSGENDGATPMGSVAFDGAGNLYGTTNFGGMIGGRGNGTIFKLTPAGTESVLHAFAGGSGDVYSPYANVAIDGNGNIYGTAALGGSGFDGGVFKINKRGVESVLHAFTGADGSVPVSDLTIGADGKLYGTTNGGGQFDLGTVFRLTPAGSETVLHSFSGMNGEKADGAHPEGGVIFDASGNLYGTLADDGTGFGGFVFRLAPDGTEKVLHTFEARRDGAHPHATLTADGLGNVYGTAPAGGVLKTDCDYGCGSVFRVAGQ